MADSKAQQKPWSLFSRYGHVLLYIYRHPGVRMRDISTGLELTERTVQKIILRLEESGTLERKREGRNNRYWINFDLDLPHQGEMSLDLQAILVLALQEFEKFEPDKG